MTQITRLTRIEPTRKSSPRDPITLGQMAGMAVLGLGLVWVAVVVLIFWTVAFAVLAAVKVGQLVVRVFR